ncbi:tail fiber domain-containing protein [Rhizobium sp. CC-YZS058]|uniref:tail fiber domain-containing protein n=1 Tax=Rhizobium sp. CC-YZS058 TaxID=3042153 RepID=UPI002B06155F|nr:tail fiber domain-containing protein [Rhizobium sp. CC-YZS058]MEA3533228.1 tail fiber domain-containing protein [Rhizobium sp. CC-YZS058]
MGGQTSTQQTESKPPAWSKPLFEQSAMEAQKLYNAGKGANPYLGDTTAGLGGTTIGGIRDIQAANNYLPDKTMSASNLRGMAKGKYLNDSFSQDNLAGMASGNMLDSSFAQKNLSDVASGKYLASGNPYFKDALQAQLNDTADQVQSSFAGSGRYGSGANTGVLTSQLGNIRASAMSDQYNRDMQNMLTANGQIDAARAGLRGDMLSANSQIDSTRAGLMNNMLAANGQIDAANSNLFQNRILGGQAQIDAGKLQDAARQAELDAAQNRFIAKDNEGWNRLGLLQSAAAGSAGNYGLNTTTQRTSGNFLQDVGAVGSGIGGMKRSDYRLKENISPVGSKNGLPIYEWNYIGDGLRYRGVMAQDVLAVMPEAVGVYEDGFLGVFYDRIGIEMELA